MGRDHRSQAEKACIGWNHVWMEETDSQGCKFRDWASTVAQNDENENQLGGDIQEGGGQQGGDIQQGGGQQGGVHQGGVQQAAGQQAALSRRVHIDQNGGGSNNLELIEVHTDSLVAVEAVKVVLHQFEPVRPYL